MLRFLIPLLAAGSLCAEPTFKRQPNPAKLLSPAIREASGLACSPTAPDFLWIVNDSGGSNEIHLANTDGTPRGSVSVSGVVNADWEDLAAFNMDGKPRLLIADTGDNQSQRKACTIYIIAEPDLPADGKAISGSAPIETEIHFTYEDGPRDCEAVGVDVQGKRIILISKRTEVPGGYELPLAAANNAVARKVGTAETKASVLPRTIAFPNQPTGMDISADGTMATVVTYYGVFLFRRNAAETWADAFRRKPADLGPHGLPQAEAVAFSKDGKGIFALSERANSSIVRFDLTD